MNRGSKEGTLLDMVFSSIIFCFLFLPILLVLYYAVFFLLKGTTSNLSNIILTIGSIVFYAWGEPLYVFLMLLSVIINYIIGRMIGKRERYKRFWLLGGGNLQFRGIDIVNMISPVSLNNLNMRLPIGISFYTFQSISYLADVYWKKVRPAEKFSEVALYICFFPQLIAGPIVQYRDIQKEIRGRRCDAKLFEEGVFIFITGLAKKVLLSNIVGNISNQIMLSNYEYLGCTVAWIGAICYTLHIYYDFSGYSDMAIGLGKMFGFHLPVNFRYPYISKNITEFWRRWHITLSCFFRDYVYIPLGGSKYGNVYFHLIVVFLLTGIWHGANFTFLLWGIWHGIFMLMERFFRNRGKLISNSLSWFYTMIVVVFGWVIFSADSVKSGLSYLRIMLGLDWHDITLFGERYYLTGFNTVVILIAVIGCTPVVTNFLDKYLVNYPHVYRAGKILIFVVTLMYLMTGNYNPFIYFQF